MSFDLHTTVDYYDDLYLAGRLIEPHELETMFANFVSLGIKRVNWIVHTWWTVDLFPYADSPNLVSFIAKTARAHGLEIYVCLKPYECSFSVPGRSYLPHTFPQTDGAQITNDLRGLNPICDPFMAANPHLRYKRAPGKWTVDQNIARIDLIKLGETPTRVRKEHLSIHVGENNGQLEPFPGDFELVETTGWRDGFMQGHLSRILSLRGLRIPSRYRYLFVRCSLTDGEPDFGNTAFRLMEIYDDQDNRLPSIPAEDRIDPEKVQWPWPESGTLPYGQMPEVKVFLADREKVEAACQDLYVYDRRTAEPNNEGPRYLDQRGFAGVACGKNEYLQGPMNLIHPEVQDYWLDIAKTCLEAGIDGINVRFACHSAKSHERDEYGLGEDEVVKGAMMANGRIDREKARQINGDAVTHWLKRLRSLTQSYGASLAAHVNSSLMYPDERMWRASHNTPPVPNTEFQWKRWIDEELVDEVALKVQAISKARFEHYVDAVSNYATDAGVKVTYVGSSGIASEFQSGHLMPSAQRRLRDVMADPRITAYDFYEVANYMRLNQQGVFEIAPAFFDLIREAEPRAATGKLETSAKE